MQLGAIKRDAVAIYRLGRRMARNLGAEIAPVARTDFQLTSSDGLETIEVLLHVGEGAGGEAHVAVWATALADSGVRCAILTRNLAVYHRAAEMFPEVSQIYAKDVPEIEEVVRLCAGVRTLLYTSNTGNNLHLLRFNHLRHVFVGHGDSEKSASAHKFFRAYDEVWTAGKAHIDRFLNSGVDFGHVKFRIVGRPTLDASAFKRVSRLNKRFLYLPTWEGYYREQDYSSAPMIDELLKAARAACGYDGIVKLHPWCGKRDPLLRDAEKRLNADEVDTGHLLVLDRSSSYAPYVELSDFLITDVSSVITDYLPSGKPIFVFVQDGNRVALARSSVPLESYAYTFSNVEQLGELVRQVIGQGEDPLKEQRDKALNYFVGVEETMRGAFATELQASVGRLQSARVA